MLQPDLPYFRFTFNSEECSTFTKINPNTYILKNKTKNIHIYVSRVNYMLQ